MAPPFTVSIVSWGLPDFTVSEEERGSLLHLRDLGPELELARAAMLYADRVTIFSPTYHWNNIILNAIGSIEVNPERYIELLEANFSINPFGYNLDPAFSEGFSPLVKLKNKIRRGYGNDRIRARAQLKKELRKYVEEIERGRTIIDRTELEVAEINAAFSEGLLEIVPFPGLSDTKDLGVFAKEIGTLIANIVTSTEIAPPKRVEKSLQTACEQLQSALTDPNCYPIFDNHAKKWLGALPDTSIDKSSAQRSTASGVTGLVMGQLPTENASLNELHELREKLGDHLEAFRAKMLDLSNEVRLAQWDSDFEESVDMLYRKQVAPQVAEIDRKLNELRASRPFNRLKMVPSAAAAGGAVTVGLAKAAELGDSWLEALLPPEMALGAGAVSVAFKWLGDLWSEHREKMNRIKDNEFYYFHQAGVALHDKIS